MSRLRKLVAEIKQMPNGDSFNTDLYKDGAIEAGTYDMKDDVIERVLEELAFDVDYHQTPEEGYGFHFEMKGTGNLSSVKSQYGELTEDDIHYLGEQLGDSQIVTNYVKDMVNDVDPELGSHSLDTTFRIEGETVTFTVTVN